MPVQQELIIKPRREFLLKAVNVGALKGLEIGALDEPLVKKKDVKERGTIFYLDHLSTEELEEKYRNDASVKTDEIVSVDFVCRDGGILKATSGHKFDYVVASHVVEHAPNLLLFMLEVYNILNPGGKCVLIIPDKRFTFDVNRPVSTFGSVLESFLSKTTYPSISAVYDHSAMAINSNGHNLWHGIVNADDTRLLASEGIAWEAAHRVHKEGHYYDVHVNVFTPHSFFEIFKKAILHDIISFEVCEFEDTKPGSIEFMVALKKPVTGTQASTKRDYLRTIPSLTVENFLSPYMPQVKALSEVLKNTTKIAESFQNELRNAQGVIAANEERICQLQEYLHLNELVLNRRSIKFTLAFVDSLHKMLSRIGVNRKKT